MARNRRLQVVVSEAQAAALEQIARERDLTGGPGVPEGEPNLAAAIRWAMVHGDKRLANGPDLKWSRSPKASA